MGFEGKRAGVARLLGVVALVLFFAAPWVAADPPGVSWFIGHPQRGRTGVEELVRTARALGPQTAWERERLRGIPDPGKDCRTWLFSIMLRADFLEHASPLLAALALIAVPRKRWPRAARVATTLGTGALACLLVQHGTLVHALDDVLFTAPALARFSMESRQVAYLLVEYLPLVLALEVAGVELWKPRAARVGARALGLLALGIAAAPESNRALPLAWAPTATLVVLALALLLESARTAPAAVESRESPSAESPGAPASTPTA